MSPNLDRTFAALADPTRRAILARLALGQASVTELAEPFAISLPAISRHLKVLERAALISRAAEGQFRPCALTADPLRQASDWLDHYRQFWNQSLDRLAEHLERTTPKEGPRHDRPNRRRPSPGRNRN
ncbi:MAG: helix-turn-helix transcriptional regulator [Alphaproteobacteria bacterium]|nr:helix-turn-helix transcriptional regulator [Alphaproteobacteria bacterium]